MSIKLIYFIKIVIYQICNFMLWQLTIKGDKLNDQYYMISV